jgi:voltage-gated potassium channel
MGTRRGVSSHLTDTSPGKRRYGPPRTCDEDEFERWLRATTERADPFMAWLGVVFALVVGYGLTVDLTPAGERALEIVGWVVWGVFAAEFVAHLWVAPSRRRYVRRHWLQVLMLLVPTLRVLRFVRLVRVGRALPVARVLSSSYRGAGAARRIVRWRLGYVGALATIVALGVAELAFFFERDDARPAFDSFGDALLWALTVVIALQADPVPSSVPARIVMVAGFVFGLVVITSLAGALGAYFVESGRERQESDRA